jgi:hypothetical protein
MATTTLPLSRGRSIAALTVVALLGAGLFLLGRATAPGDPGFAAGRAQGVAEGRALQQPAPSRAAFAAGYAAGADDVFGGYDGGWDLGRPYVITLARGSGAVTYRIASRR